MDICFQNIFLQRIFNYSPHTSNYSCLKSSSLFNTKSILSYPMQSVFSKIEFDISVWWNRPLSYNYYTWIMHSLATKHASFFFMKIFIISTPKPIFLCQLKTKNFYFLFRKVSKRKIDVCRTERSRLY
jgi:hypothetical protein